MSNRCAVIDTETGRVVNVIVAAPDDPAPAGAALVALPDDAAIDDRYRWSQDEGFVPGPDLQAERDARAAEIEAWGLAFDD